MRVFIARASGAIGLRLVSGEAGVVLMTEARSAANAIAKHGLGWALRHPSWRQGFVESYHALK